MARFHGVIGFTEQAEVSPGVWEHSVVEKRMYYGDILRNKRVFAASSSSTNDNVQIANQLSVVSDNYMRHHLNSIRFAVVDDIPWQITNVEIDEKRIVLTLGEVYAGNAD